MAKVIISQPGQRTRSARLKERLTSIGRRPDNDVPLESDTNVSKYHAVIENRGGEYWLKDIGSSNGTTVNGEPLRSPRRLRDGDLVCLGGTSTMEFHSAEKEQPLAAAPDKTVAGMPAVRLPPQPSVNLPTTVPSFPQAPPIPQAPSPSAVVQNAVVFPKAALFGIIGVGSLGALLAVLWGVGVIGGGAGAKSPTSGRAASAARAGTSETAGASETSAASEAARGGGGSTAEGAQPAAPQSADASTSAAAPVEAEASAAPSSTGADPNTEVMANLARTLAVQISQKSFYKFDPNFVALINTYVNEYRAAAGYYERAGKYRAAIDREFVNVQGIQPPLIAYITAMSQTKFLEKGGGGVWKLSARAVGAHADADGADMNDPAPSTRVAAAYLRELLDLFEKDNFMYAVACYGMPLDEAGQVKLALENADPGGRERYDFWKMKNAGVVRGEQVERVARFFAAGIVCENPRQFGLKEEPLSSLY